MKRFLMFIILLGIFTQVKSENLEFEEVWQKENMTLAINTISPFNNVVVYDMRYRNRLQDILTGEDIFVVDTTENIVTDYSGERFFVFNDDEKTLFVYNRYTKDFIRQLTYRNYQRCRAVSDSIMIEIDSSKLILNYWNIYQDEITYSINITMPEVFAGYSAREVYDFSQDADYLRLLITKANASKYVIYDAKKNEFLPEFISRSPNIFETKFFHHSNLIAFPEQIKLGDDTIHYNYIRIYDLDLRQFSKNIKVDFIVSPINSIFVRNDDKFILFHFPTDFFTTSWYHFYDLDQDVHIPGKVNLPLMVHYYGDSIIVSMGNYGYRQKSPASIDNNIPINDITIYPNPAGDYITIQFSNKGLQPFAEVSKVQIFDVLGLEILSVGIGLDLSSQRIDVSHLPAGVYFIKIGNKVEKFVKM